MRIYLFFVHHLITTTGKTPGFRLGTMTVLNYIAGYSLRHGQPMSDNLLQRTGFFSVAETSWHFGTSLLLACHWRGKLQYPGQSARSPRPPRR